MRVFLIGFMGVGKTTYGKKLAKLLNLNFIDLDFYIEKKHKSTISYIFNLVGEDGFRLIEHRMLLEVLQQDNYVLSTGGGTPCFYNNIDLITNSGLTIYISLTPTEISNRLLNTKKRRPMLEGLSNEELNVFVAKKLRQRLPFYNKAHHIVNGTNLKTITLYNLIM